MTDGPPGAINPGRKEITMSETKARIIEENGVYTYLDREGNEIHDGDTIMWADGRTEKLYATVQGLLGTDATNPSWLASGRAVECQYGVYPLTWSDVQEIVKVDPQDVEHVAKERKAEHEAEMRRARREAEMKKLAEYGKSMIREFGRRKDIIVTYDRPDKKTISRYTEYQRSYHKIMAGSEYFLFWEEETGHLLYVKDVTADSALTAAAEMVWLAAKKF